jgi:hypothetical protein
MIHVKKNTPPDLITGVYSFRVTIQKYLVQGFAGETIIVAVETVDVFIFLNQAVEVTLLGLVLRFKVSESYRYFCYMHKPLGAPGSKCFLFWGC